MIGLTIYSIYPIGYILYILAIAIYYSITKVNVTVREKTRITIITYICIYILYACN